MTLTLFKAWWPLIAVAGSGIAGFATIASDVTHIQQQVKALETDHDVLVRVDERQKTMSDDMKTIKEDVKDIAKAVK